MNRWVLDLGVAARATTTALLAGALLLAAASAQAADGAFQNRLVNSIQIRSNGIAYIHMAIVRTGGASPACSASSQQYFTVDISTPTGKALVDLAITAYLTGKTVNMYSDGTCLGNYERVRLIEFF